MTRGDRGRLGTRAGWRRTFSAKACGAGGCVSVLSGCRKARAAPSLPKRVYSRLLARGLFPVPTCTARSRGDVGAIRGVPGAPQAAVWCGPCGRAMLRGLTRELEPASRCPPERRPSPLASRTPKRWRTEKRPWQEHSGSAGAPGRRHNGQLPRFGTGMETGGLPSGGLAIVPRTGSSPDRLCSPQLRLRLRGRQSPPWASSSPGSVPGRCRAGQSYHLAPLAR
ncbi:uncharacterized protein [Pithys albifrons albifrons]|uniref:uncharacterized protein n=1 Tax=Pithys albifrons albifrons TaxID=3385563 RepID=UPI003A5CF737